MKVSRITKIGVFVIIGLISIAVVFLITNAVLMNNMIKKEVAHLKSDVRTSIKKYTDQDLEGLHEPVQRYFRHVLKPGQTHPAWVSYVSSGRFKLPFSEKSFEVSANEYLSADKPGLIFDATFKNCPFWCAWVHVRDKYEARKGNMFGNLFSGIKIVNAHNAEELDQDMFLRCVGQLVMIPTALLPSAHVNWEAINKNTAKLTVTDGGNSGTATVAFNPAGEIVRWETEGRYDRFEGQYRKVKHIGFRSNYRPVAGVKVPHEFRVEKILPDGAREVFWKGTIRDVRFSGTNR